MPSKIRPSSGPNLGKHISGKALAHQAPNPDQLPPKFSFHYLQKNYCITCCTKDEQVSFVERMHRLSQLTWAQLRQADRHGLGYEIISRGSLNVKIPQGITDDVHIIAFRFCAKAPMVGYRSADGTFHIIWFDRDFTVYDHR